MIPAYHWQREIDLCEFDSLVYIVSPGQPELHSETLSPKKGTQTTEEAKRLEDMRIRFGFSSANEEPWVQQNGTNC